jgi:hypothetical protein
MTPRSAVPRGQTPVIVDRQSGKNQLGMRAVYLVQLWRSGPGFGMDDNDSRIASAMKSSWRSQLPSCPEARSVQFVLSAAVLRCRCSPLGPGGNRDGHPKLANVLWQSPGAASATQPEEVVMRMRMLLLCSVLGLIAMAAPGATLANAVVASTCSGGPIPGGTYGTFTVTGNCFAANGANVQINGDLIIAPGAILNDHAAESFRGAQMHITGNVLVGAGAVLGLGYNAPEATLGPDTVGGSIIANQPLTLYVGNVTIGGSLTSSGGGLKSTSVEDFRNFPIKDNSIGGNLVVQGWRGGWFGVIRNHVGGSVIVVNNVSQSNPETGPGVDPDSTEIMGSFGAPQTIGGSLICFGNVPAAQVNPTDGGVKNIVAGSKVGECANL